MHIIRQYLKVMLRAAKLKPCLALNTKQPVSCLKKKNVAKVSRVKVLEGKYFFFKNLNWNVENVE